MSNVIDMIQYNHFKFVVLPGSDPDPQYMHHYQSAYECWLKVWSKAYKEFEITKQLLSDSFTRQTEINCVFYGSQCVALLFLKWTDFNSAASKNDSYFKLWNEEELKLLSKDGSKILVCSYTTVAEEWRKSSRISMKDLIVYFSTQRFMQSTASAMTAVTRKTRGIHKLTERFGAKILKENIPNFNSEDLVDLCAFYRDSVTEGTDQTVKELGRTLMKNITVVPRVVTELEMCPAKKIAA